MNLSRSPSSPTSSMSVNDIKSCGGGSRCAHTIYISYNKYSLRLFHQHLPQSTIKLKIHQNFLSYSRVFLVISTADLTTSTHVRHPDHVVVINIWSSIGPEELRFLCTCVNRNTDYIALFS